MIYSKFTPLLFVSLLCTFSLGQGLGFEYDGVKIKTVDRKGKVSYIKVKREIPEECKSLPISNHTVWTGDYAHESVPKACKSSYVHTTGNLLPMLLDEEIVTFGELEVLAYMKQMQKDHSMLLIDARKEDWYNYRTIPGAINMPFEHFKERQAFEFEFEEHLLSLNVDLKADGSFEFGKAKTVLIFCNGPWCSQSVAMVEALLKIGYPAQNINWYRGGMQTWLNAGLTSTRN